MKKTDINGIFGRLDMAARGVSDISEFCETLERFGISNCVISSTDALLHDVKRGNDRTFDFCSRSGGRLLPCAVINPRWPVREAEECIDQGTVGLKLCPGFHRFSLCDKYVMSETVEIFREKKIPIIIQTGIPSLDTSYRSLDISDLKVFCENNPELKIIIAGLTFLKITGFLTFLKSNPHVMLDSSYIYGAGFFEDLVHAGLEDQLCFGTGYGIQSPAAGLSIIEDCDIKTQAKEKILYTNISSLIEKAI